MVRKARILSIIALCIASAALTTYSVHAFHASYRRLSNSAVIRMGRQIYPTGTSLVTLSWKNVGKASYWVSDHALLEKLIKGKWTIITGDFSSSVDPPSLRLKPGDVQFFNFHFGTFPFYPDHPEKPEFYNPDFENIFAFRTGDYTTSTGIYRITAFYVITYARFGLNHIVTFPVYAHFIVL